MGMSVLVGAIVLAGGFGGYKYHQGQISLAIQSGQQYGYQAAIVEMIKVTSNEKCEAANLYVGEDKVDLINTKCVKPDGFIGQGGAMPGGETTEETDE